MAATLTATGPTVASVVSSASAELAGSLTYLPYEEEARGEGGGAQSSTRTRAGKRGASGSEASRKVPIERDRRLVRRARGVAALVPAKDPRVGPRLAPCYLLRGSGCGSFLAAGARS